MDAAITELAELEALPVVFNVVLFQTQTDCVFYASDGYRYMTGQHNGKRVRKRF